MRLIEIPDATLFAVFPRFKGGELLINEMWVGGQVPRTIEDVLFHPGEIVFTLAKFQAIHCSLNDFSALFPGSFEEIDGLVLHSSRYRASYVLRCPTLVVK